MLVNARIDQLELKEQLLRYIDYQTKKGFPFGELLVLHYDIFKGMETMEIYTVAAAVEMLILSFDMLDDFEDDDCKDKPWSTEPSLALNATTALLVMSASVIRETDFPNKDKAISILLKYAQQSINGQHKDLLGICRSEADYIEMTLEKSGSLVSIACLVGAVLAVTADYPKEVEAYSKLIGLIGQINNDLVDVRTWDEKNDLVNRKFTLPIIYLLNCEDDELKLISDYYDNRIDESEIRKNQALIDKKLVATGAIDYTEVVKRIYQNKALAEVEKLNIGKDQFDQLIKYIY